MSIYPVPLAEWYPIGDVHYMGDVIGESDFYRCDACGRKPKYSKCYGHHSLPFGYGEVWCNEKCQRSGKTARLDKRRERSRLRRWGRSDKKDWITVTMPEEKIDFSEIGE